MTLNPLPTGNNPRQLLDSLLDRGYVRTTGRVLDAIAANATSGTLGTRLNELENEALRLQAAGLPLTPDNAVLVALRADLDTALNQYARALDNVSGAVQADGVQSAGVFVRATSLPGISDGQLAQIGIAWNRPDPEAINAVVNYTGKSAWQAELNLYKSGIGRVAQNVAIRGIALGQSPLATARELRDVVTGLPLSRANSIMRTLQMQGFRDATALNQLVNIEILSEQIRLCAFNNSCLCCIGLHGTRMPIGEVVLDHDQGKCCSIATVRGRDIVVPSGQVWFNNLTEMEQREIAGHANYEAMKAGAVTLRDFVQPYTSPIYGPMLREASLSGIIGSEAEQYYSR